jgi:hypothetical protein
MSLYIVRKSSPRRREIEDYAVAPYVTLVRVSAVEQSVVNHHGIAFLPRKSNLIGLVTHGSVVWVQIVGVSSVNFWKDPVDRYASKVSARQHSQRTVLDTRVR